ncbi:MAG: ClcB-like voltage-gated chloride channel protein [Verrucomicrobia bacterium]|nr:ClcB-like voltage-gated chloride channel protein [Verrucomicrobiota bacterium]
MDAGRAGRAGAALSPRLRALLRLKLWLSERFRLSERQVTLLWAVFIGLAGALVSDGFRKATDLVTVLLTNSTHTSIQTFGHLPWWQRLLVPPLGGLFAGTTLWIGNRLLASIRQKSTTDYMEAVVIGNGRISASASLVKTLSALFSISSGASIGREGPLVQLSTLVASVIGQLRQFPVPQRRQLVACGAAAGIASAYNAPIAGAFFVSEIVLGTVVVDSLGPLILASVVATFTTRAIHGNAALYQSADLDLHTRWEALPLILMGILLGLLAPVYLRVLRGTERLFTRLTVPVSLKMALSGAAVGAIAVFFPDVCGNGQNLIRSIFHQNWFWDTVLTLILAKLAATLITFGSGAVGGVFTPTLFIGAATGVLYGQLVLYLAPQLQPDPTIYGLVGMGAFLAATTGAPLMAILMVFELTLSYAIVPFLMVACVLAYYCSSVFERRFLYGESLERKGAAFFSRQLAELNLLDLIRKDPITLAKSASFAEVARTFVQHRFQHIYIVDEDRRLLGAVSLHDVKAFLDRPELESVVIAADIMVEDFPRIFPHQSLRETLQKFAEAQSERLPVVDNYRSQRLIGSVSKTDIMLHLAGDPNPAGAMA